jgi:hypothetical protein
LIIAKTLRCPMASERTVESFWRSNGVAREQCDFSGISHSYILWNFPLKSHSADAAQADRQAIRFSSIEIARRPSCHRRSRVPRRSCSWRRQRRGREPRSRYRPPARPFRTVSRFWPLRSQPEPMPAPWIRSMRVIEQFSIVKASAASGSRSRANARAARIAPMRDGDDVAPGMGRSRSTVGGAGGSYATRRFCPPPSRNHPTAGFRLISSATTPGSWAKAPNDAESSGRAERADV